MTAPEPNPEAISFQQLIFEIMPNGERTLELWECGACAAILRPETRQKHAEWHGQLRFHLAMASL